MGRRQHTACEAQQPNLCSNARISEAGHAGLNRKPCTSWQPSMRSLSNCSIASTPAASVVMLRLRPSPVMAQTIARQSGRSARSFPN
jgi:hypothetical protein